MFRVSKSAAVLAQAAMAGLIGWLLCSDELVQALLASLALPLLVAALFLLTLHVWRADVSAKHEGHVRFVYRFGQDIPVERIHFVVSLVVWPALLALLALIGWALYSVFTRFV